MARSTVADFNDLPVILTAQDVAETMGISLANAYLLFKRAGFPSIWVSDKRVVCPRDKFLHWLDMETDRKLA